jgi:hypothetical protein
MFEMLAMQKQQDVLMRISVLKTHDRKPVKVQLIDNRFLAQSCTISFWLGNDVVFASRYGPFLSLHFYLQVQVCHSKPSPSVKIVFSTSNDKRQIGSLQKTDKPT